MKKSVENVDYLSPELTHIPHCRKCMLLDINRLSPDTGDISIYSPGNWRSENRHKSVPALF
jgi:hypothetical protein